MMNPDGVDDQGPLNTRTAHDDQRINTFNRMTREGLQSGPQVYNRPLVELRAERAFWAVKTAERSANWITVADSIRSRLMRAEPSRGVYVHVHGGGWVLGAADQQDRLLTSICDSAGVTVISLEYRLAPEHPFPAALDDVSTALAWVIEQGSGWVRGHKVIVGGESAGANLAVGALCRLRSHRNFSRIAGVCLNYGTFDLAGTPSMRAAAADTPFLNPPLGAWFSGHYVPSSLYANPEVSPLHADLRGLPPAQFLVGSADPVVDDSRLMHARWLAAGSRSDLRVIRGGLHGLLEYQTPVTKHGRDLQARFISKAFAGSVHSATR